MVDPKVYRPTEIDVPFGNAAKAKLKLGWKSAIDLETFVAMMVDADMERVANKQSGATNEASNGIESAYLTGRRS
jgi:GDP-D-mannose dehydratase